MDTKQFGRVEIKDADQGQVLAVIATYNAIDKDGDVTIPGAFTDGAELVISAYGHTSWQGQLPVGKGVIRTTPTEARVECSFFLDTAAGRETFAVVKALGSLGQWSYGYDATDVDYGTFQGSEVRFLKGLQVHEASPVLVGAGVNTRTLTAKQIGEREFARYVGSSLGLLVDPAQAEADREYMRFVRAGLEAAR